MPDLSVQTFQPQSVTVVQNGAAPPSGEAPAKKGGFSFGDFIDMINPLHHIPVVGQVYRAVTGDQISDSARIAGGGLFAGPLGIGIAAATISMRGDASGERGGEAPMVAPQDGAQTQQSSQPQTNTPQGPAMGVPIGQSMAQYEAISQRYWTQSNLNALAQSMSLKVPEAAEKATKAEAMAERLPAQPVAKVSTAKPLENPQGNSAVYAQMLANLDKMEALEANPR